MAPSLQTWAPAPFTPTLLAPGVLGHDRAKKAWDLTRTMFVENALPQELRVALASAAMEGPDGAGNGVHSTGIMLLIGADGVNVGEVWDRMSQKPETRRLLRATVELGQGKEVPAHILEQVYNTLGPWTGAWQDLVAFTSWYNSLYLANLAVLSSHPDPRLDAWLSKMVVAVEWLPNTY